MINITFCIISVIIIFILISVLINFKIKYKKLKFVKSKLEERSKTLLKELNNLENKLKTEKQKIEKILRNKSDSHINISNETKKPLEKINNYFKNKNDNINNITIKNLFKKTINCLDIAGLNHNNIIYNHNIIVNVSALLEKITKIFENEAYKKRIIITSNIEKYLYTKIDPCAINKILYSIMDNAVKNNIIDSNIYVSLSKIKDDKLELCITDSGNGIPDESINYINIPIYHMNQNKINIQGISLDLSIVKNIIDEVNGHIKIIRTIDEETSFEITLQVYYLKKGDPVALLDNYNIPFNNNRNINNKFIL